jgi:hypothetical protein
LYGSAAIGFRTEAAFHFSTASCSAASEIVIAQAVAGGEALYKNQVHDPVVRNFKNMAERFEGVLRKFVS